MANSEYTLESGAKLLVSMVPFDDALALQRALANALKGIPLTADVFEKDITQLKDAVLSVVSSVEVTDVLHRCMARSTYNNIRLTKDLFDDPKLAEQIRQDYYSICWRVIEVNCKPFFFQIFSKLKGFKPTSTDTQK